MLSFCVCIIIECNEICVYNTSETVSQYLACNLMTFVCPDITLKCVVENSVYSSRGCPVQLTGRANPCTNCSINLKVLPVHYWEIVKS